MSHKLFTKEIQSGAWKFPLHSQDEKEDEALVWAKYFHPAGRYTFYVTEMNIEMLESLGNRQIVEGTAFGFVRSPLGSDCDELGYVDLNEMASLRGRFGLGIERDMYFTPCTLGEIRSGVKS